MKKFYLLLTGLMFSLAAAAQAKLDIVATTPDFGAIAQVVGGDKVRVTSLARGTEDPHFVDAKPSFARVLNKADLLIEGGADLEIGWLPPLVENARNRKILLGASGRMNASEGIPLLEVPTGKVDRSGGDIHPLGNPHYMLDPMNAIIVARHLAAQLSQMDPSNASAYDANLKAFVTTVEAKMKEWNSLMAPFKGAKVVAYHKSYEYLAARFGLEVIGYIEPKPGIEPSPTHINALIPKMKQEGAKLVMMEPNRPRKTPEYVAQSLGVKLVMLPILVNGNDESTDYIKLMDYNIHAIANGLK